MLFSEENDAGEALVLVDIIFEWPPIQEAGVDSLRRVPDAEFCKVACFAEYSLRWIDIKFSNRSLISRPILPISVSDLK